jgi:serine/threonine-protein kinase RsbT
MQTFIPSVDSGPFQNETRTAIRSTVDIVTARQRGRAAAITVGFSGADVTLVAAAISEVARNIVDHAGEGELTIEIIVRDGRRGMQIVARDHGPGIPDVAQAMRYGYSTRRGIGMGLPGAKWLMDEFDIASTVGVGTTVTMTKWLPIDLPHSHAA